VTAWLAVVLCAGAPVDDGPQAIAVRARHVQTLRARMLQEKELAVLGDVIRSEGTFLFERPRRLRMDLGGDSGTVLVIDGDRMVTHYKGLGKTERVRLSRDERASHVADHLFLLLDGDPVALGKVYEVEVRGREPLQVRLTPRSDGLAKVIRYVDAELDRRGFVASITVREANGDRTAWRFVDAVVNARLPASSFAPGAQ
jgi:outer membrane lipoprotein-sorting protein